MRYKVHRLDKRFSYCDHFQFYIGFTGKMINQLGPLDFNHALKWFYETYGWSAEIRQWGDMLRHVDVNHLIHRQISKKNSSKSPLPEACNSHWSWTNGYDDLRIYVASDKELAFFRLAHPVDQ